MSYNILLNSTLNDLTHWKFINCKYENGHLLSANKIFGIEQELVLPDPTKLYFRWEYNILESNIKDVKIGIQNKDTLNINKKRPKQNKEQKISVIDIAEQEKIKVHLIFESNEDLNKVKISQPLLVDLININKSTWLKPLLDKTLVYLNGYSYTNEYIENEITPYNNDFKDWNIKKGKIGSIIDTLKDLSADLSAKFIDKNYYLVKLDFEDINKFGEINLKYGLSNSIKLDDEQLYLMFKANKEDRLTLNLTSKDIISYKTNIKHLMIIDITKLNLIKKDIPYLPFI